ncbi:MAG: 30S ribosomal protein S17 [Candidatus Omnitrophota bacterium]|jgi:small subunit ribosomal protein S17
MKAVKSKGSLEGVVISDKMKKTIVVKVINKFLHPVYTRLIVKKKKYKVHDENNTAKIGDKVRIVGCKPHSKEKRFRLVEVLK